MAYSNSVVILREKVTVKVMFLYQSPISKPTGESTEKMTYDQHIQEFNFN